MESSDPLRKYAEEKTERLAKYFFEPIEAHWVLSVEKIRHIADCTIVASGVTTKAQGDTQDMYSAVDMAIDKLEAQAKKHKDKTKGHKAHSPNASIKYITPGTEGVAARPKVVKKENQFLKPMSVEEAAMQMDVVDKAFLVFTDSITSNINVIYRLEDGAYGLIETTVK